jgi:hypothetical protein
VLGRAAASRPRPRRDGCGHPTSSGQDSQSVVQQPGALA